MPKQNVQLHDLIESYGQVPVGLFIEHFGDNLERFEA